MSKSIVIGCKLPHGIILEHPSDITKIIELNGKNKAMIIGSEYGITEVDSEFFEQWNLVNKNFPALKSGAIFMAKNTSDIVSMASEFKERKTGFEPMRTDGKDERAAGVKKAEY